MPASRPTWKGYIKLALVSCPVALWPASSPAERIVFRQINRQTGNRIRQQAVDDVTRDPVDLANRAKGYEFDKDRFLLIDDAELKSIEIESTRTIEIDSFVPRAEIDERFLDSPYYIAPNEPVGAEAFAVIREAMRDKGMAALARVVLSSRERVVMLQPWNQGMLGMTLRYPYELRNEDEYFHNIPDVKIDPELLRLAEHILQNRTATFDPTRFVDRYEQAVVELIESKKKGLPAHVVHAPVTPRGTIDLMDALKRSLAKAIPLANDDKRSKPARAKKPKPRVEGQTEMLLPIAGGKAVAKKEPARISTAKRKAG